MCWRFSVYIYCTFFLRMDSIKTISGPPQGDKGVWIFVLCLCFYYKFSSDCTNYLFKSLNCVTFRPMTPTRNNRKRGYYKQHTLSVWFITNHNLNIENENESRNVFLGNWKWKTHRRLCPELPPPFFLTFCLHIYFQ